MAQTATEIYKGGMVSKSTVPSDQILMTRFTTSRTASSAATARRTNASCSSRSRLPSGAGAAVALRSKLVHRWPTRMCVVMDSCESPKPRIAIETVFDGEGDEGRVLNVPEQASVPRD